MKALAVGLAALMLSAVTAAAQDRQETITDLLNQGYRVVGGGIRSFSETEYEFFLQKDASVRQCIVTKDIDAIPDGGPGTCSDRAMPALWRCGTMTTVYCRGVR